MHTKDMIEFLKSQDFTDTQAYNLLTYDLFDDVPQEEIDRAQRLIQYFLYKIQNVCFPAIRQLKSSQNGR